MHEESLVRIELSRFAVGEMNETKAAMKRRAELEISRIVEHLLDNGVDVSGIEMFPDWPDDCEDCKQWEAEMEATA